MMFELLRLNLNVTDEDFNAIYPENISLLARKHWTPVTVAQTACEFLVGEPGTRVLDIGSGAGKFCLVGAAHTRGYFTGVEQRSELVELSRQLSARHHIYNVKFVHANITAIDFRNYEAFYFYNSFYEHIDLGNKIDDKIRFDVQLYHLYSRHVVQQFLALPLGARVATYCTPLNVVPKCFRQLDSLHGGFLKFWEKVNIR
ncbi:MAG: methyltransferase domain-containing protein [Bacteroidota bacterium]